VSGGGLLLQRNEIGGDVVYRRMGVVGCLFAGLFFVLPFGVGWLVLSVAARYEQLVAAGVFRLQEAYNPGVGSGAAELNGVYEARYAIIGLVFLVCWGVSAVITLVSTRRIKK
jgi:hypothetical protein